MINQDMMQKCSFCGSDKLEKVSKKQIVCKNCGFGFGNTGKETPENMAKYLEQMVKQMNLLHLMFPLDDQKQLALRFQFHQHKFEKHPTASNGYCEYCDRNWNEMSKEEMKERLGYNKDLW